jgi:carbonic anhydrase
MSTVDDLEERNAVFAREAFSPKDSLMPTLKTIVISCVDPRVDPAHVLGLGDGEAYDVTTGLVHGVPSASTEPASA